MKTNWAEKLKHLKIENEPEQAVAPQAKPKPDNFIRLTTALEDDDIFSPEAIEEHESMFVEKLHPDDLKALNAQLERANQKVLTYRDLALMFAVFKKNVSGNKNGGCPQTSISGFTAIHEEVEYPYSSRVVAKAIKVFLNLKLAEIIAKPRKGVATCYKMLV